MEDDDYDCLEKRRSAIQEEVVASSNYYRYLQYWYYYAVTLPYVVGYGEARMISSGEAKWLSPH